jgi:3-deoxy-D-manno-octulosonic-acid transferase
MAPSPGQESRLGTFVGRLVARYMRFVRATSTVVLDPPDGYDIATRNHPFIFAMWHGQFMLMPTLHVGMFPVSAIVARHKDATALRVLLAEFDIALVRGSGASNRKRDRGGAAALRGAVRCLRKGSTFALTADIPPGPARVAGTGIVMLAKYSGRPIVPFAVATSRFLVFPTWSRMTINLPFSKLVYCLGEPILVPEDADEAVLEQRRRAVEAALNRVTERAYAVSGGNIRRVTPPSVALALQGPAPVGALLKTYQTVTSLMRFGAPAVLAARTWQGKEDPSRREERYGKAKLARPPGPIAWFHAASVGETNAVLPVIERLLAERGDLTVLLTTGTLTSAGLAKHRLPQRAIHQVIVLDVPEYVRAFLAHWKPDLAVFAESEIWPNLILEASARGIPIALVNARMSARSSRRWRRLRSVSRPLFSRFDLVLAQNEVLARSFSALARRPAGLRRSQHPRARRGDGGFGTRHDGAPARRPLHHRRATASRAGKGDRGDARGEGPQNVIAFDRGASRCLDRHLHCRHHR